MPHCTQGHVPPCFRDHGPSHSAAPPLHAHPAGQGLRLHTHPRRQGLHLHTHPRRQDLCLHAHPAGQGLYVSLCLCLSMSLYVSMSTWEGRASISTPTQQGRACPRPPRWTPLHPFFCQLPWDSEPVSTERNLYIQTRGHTGLNELDICSDTDSKASSMYQMET